MKALKEQIEQFIGGHCHFPDYNEPRFTEALLSLLETAMRDAYWEGMKNGGHMNAPGEPKRNEAPSIEKYISQIKTLINK